MWYCALKENDSHGLICLNARFIVRRTVWVGLEGVALLEEV